MAANPQLVNSLTPITIKVSIGEDIKKLKLPLKDLTADVLPAKLITILALPADKNVTFERFSDSAGGFVTLDPANPAVFKTLARAAKAKLKLRLRAIVPGDAQRNTETTPSSSASPVDAAEILQMIHRNRHLRGPMSANSGRKNVGAGIFEFKDAHPSNNKQHPMWPTGVRDSSSLPKIPQAPQAPEAPQAPSPPQAPKAEQAPQAPQAPKAPVVPQFTAAPPPPQLPQIPQNQLRFHQHPAFQPFGYVQPQSSYLPPLCPRSYNSVPSHAYTPAVFSKPIWSVYCNICDATLENEHFHCSICEGGDYDLCQNCVNSGRLCPGEGHWLVKRFFKDGTIVSSSTERLPPKPKAHVAPVEPTPLSVSSTLPIRILSNDKVDKTIPGAFEDDSKTLAEDFSSFTRTCNNCVGVMDDENFVHCDDCEDFDLCLDCHVKNSHGHHPGHAFVPAVPDKTLGTEATKLLAAGRQVAHAALCDGCDKNIVGVRHKCFECPDFDYCNDCIKGAQYTHPDHRFASLFEPIATVTKMPVVHHGVFCDGPACSSNPRQVYITGDRYKCVVCNDTDFCASCEALPGSSHNQTHPLIKIKSPIRGLSISTANDLGHGAVVSGLGDFPKGKSKMTGSRLPERRPRGRAEVFQAGISCISSVKTIADMKPSAGQTQEKQAEEDVLPSPAKVTSNTSNLQAVFVCDTIPDGITVRGKTRFTQVWTLRNPGPNAWPAGCSVRLTGGDNMLDVSSDGSIAASAIAAASESNVIAREVLAGEEVSFKVVLKAPVREGRAISFWRLKTDTGVAFGHRLWCDINVRASPFDKPATTAELASANQSFAQWKAGLKGSDTNDTLAKRLERFRTEHPPAYKPASTLKSLNLSDSMTAVTDSMVFPTLEKESPASSTHELNKPTKAAITQADSTETVVKPQPATAEDEATGEVISAKVPEEVLPEDEVDDHDVFEDISSEIEVLSASEHDDDDGFLTDEEYDILDASDEETIASAE